ncbi:DUF1918 domain-containing protein [Pseudonocardia sp.]|jgi:hypothetical protein|uniref:DUF1918 domain-containing protein n=1 Tax=Pseudonocardia sp. TaxID=60912 RepID=UPI0029F847EE|nr:DNA-binding protein [Pseudonocardia sp.]
MIMRAHVGDWLIVPPEPGHPGGRRGRVVALLHPDGTPPFRVRWLDDDHESLVVPRSDARLRCPPPDATTSTRRWGAGEWREPGPGAPRDGAPVPAGHWVHDVRWSVPERVARLRVAGPSAGGGGPRTLAGPRGARRVLS